MLSARKPTPPNARDVIIAVVVALGGTAALVGAVYLSGLRPGRAAAALVSELPSAIAAAWLLWKWDWWGRVGWRAPIWRNLWLLWVPLFFLGSSLAGSHDVPLREPVRVGSAVLAALLVGFAEESWYRGLLMEALQRSGALAATVGSAAAFGAIHLVNARVIGLSSAAVQALSAFAIGLMFAAARIRLRSLVPLVLIHAAFDVVFLTREGRPTLPEVTPTRLGSTAVMIAIAFVYAVVLTRRSKTVPENVSEVVPTLG